MPLPSPEQNYLEEAFAMNVRRIYGDKKASELIGGETHFGYILD